MNIFYSSLISKKKNIDEVFNFFADKKITNIELTGGINFDKDIEKKILFYKKKYNFNLILHNYFPAPKNEFIINLASLNKDIYNMSLKHCINSIELSKKINADKYAFHAGYLLDFNIDQVGKSINGQKLNNLNNAIERFCEAFTKLHNFAMGDVNLYIENNVLTSTNYNNFNRSIPFLLTDIKSYNELKSHIDFNLLLDTGHLNVTCKTLSLDFTSEINFFLKIAKYIHFSENNTLIDENLAFSDNNNAYRHLIKNKLQNKTITFEIKSNFDEILKLRNKFLST